MTTCTMYTAFWLSVVRFWIRAEGLSGENQECIEMRKGVVVAKEAI